MKRWTVLIAALVLWTLLSFGWLTIFSGGNVCKVLGVVPPAGSHETPTPKADLDAQVARCNEQLKPAQLLVVGAGYVLIAIPGLYMTAGKREKSDEP
jgi:hypothetical protein